MKKKIIAFVLVLFVMAVIMLVVDETKRRNSRPEDEIVEENPEGSQTAEYYTYADVMNDVKYLAETEEQRQAIEKLIDPLARSEIVTVGFLHQSLEIAELPLSLIDDIVKDASDEAFVTKDQFDILLLTIAHNNIIEGFVKEEFFVYDYYVDSATGNKCITNGGKTYIVDTDFKEEYVDKIIDIYSRDGHVFRINDYGITSYTIRNALLLSIDETTCTFLFDGRQHSMKLSQYTTANDPGNDISSGEVVAIKLDNSGVVAVTKQKDVNAVRVTEATDEKLEINERMVYDIPEDFMVYNMVGDPVCEPSRRILAGYRSVDIVKEENTIIAAIIRENLVCDNIRVILSNDNYSSYDMGRAIFTSDYPFTVTNKDEVKTTYQAGESVTIVAEDCEEGDTFIIAPFDDDKTVTVSSLLRGYGHPVYAGVLEVRVLKDGVLHIINEIPIEQYLYSVVSSEVPSNYQREAMRTLAICARGYAYYKIKDESFAKYDAHLDDSSLCQLYNNVEPNDAAVLAVKDTYGIVPSYNESIILPLRYLASAGISSTNADIWGGAPYEYLQSYIETSEKNLIDLSEEETFRSFMNNNLGYEVLEAEQPYYRWTIYFSKSDMKKAIDTNLLDRIKASSDSIMVKVDEDKYKNQEIETLGEIVAVKVTERTASGVVTALEIEGTEATIRVTGQTNIRNLITPVDQEVVRQDGQAITGWTSLPSPYYYVAEENGGFVIHGGGFGNGVGVSQTGANVLAEQGYDFKYILHYFYSNTDIKNIYSFDEKPEQTEESTDEETQTE